MEQYTKNRFENFISKVVSLHLSLLYENLYISAISVLAIKLTVKEAHIESVL